MLEERSVAQQRFIHIISHDLREPVNTIVNFASLLASDHAADLSESGRQYLRYVSNGGERMRELLDDLLNFVRIDHAHLELRTVDLDRVMQGVREDLADAIARSNAVVYFLCACCPGAQLNHCRILALQGLLNVRCTAHDAMTNLRVQFINPSSE